MADRAYFTPHKQRCKCTSINEHIHAECLVPYKGGRLASELRATANTAARDMYVKERAEALKSFQSILHSALSDSLGAKLTLQVRLRFENEPWSMQELIKMLEAEGFKVTRLDATSLEIDWSEATASRRARRGDRG